MHLPARTENPESTLASTCDHFSPQPEKTPTLDIFGPRGNFRPIHVRSNDRSFQKVRLDERDVVGVDKNPH